MASLKQLKTLIVGNVLSLEEITSDIKSNGTTRRFNFNKKLYLMTSKEIGVSFVTYDPAIMCLGMSHAWNYAGIERDYVMIKYRKMKNADDVSSDLVIMEKVLDEAYTRRIVYSKEDLLKACTDNWSEYEKKRIAMRRAKKADRKAFPDWTPQHFPQGTIVTFNENVAEKRGGIEAQHEVFSICQNGPNSYLLEFMEQCPHIEDSFMKINIDHVNKVIKRGDGPVVFSKDFHRARFCDIANYEDLMTKPKGHYLLFGNYRDVIYHVIDKYTKQGECVDIERFITEINKLSSIVKKNDVHGYSDIRLNRGLKLHVSISKKKLNAFIKRNINRFLISPKKFSELDDFENNLRYEEDLDDEWDRDYGEIDFSQ